MQEFLEQRNVTATTPEEVVLDYVPKLKLRYDEALGGQPRRAGALGLRPMCLDASGVSNAETMVRTASLMLVIDMKGEVIAVRPTPGYGTMGIQPIQMSALKMRDPWSARASALSPRQGPASPPPRLITTRARSPSRSLAGTTCCSARTSSRRTAAARS